MPPAQSDSKFYSSSYSPSSPADVKKSSSASSDKETLIIFDWDDTLLASSFLSAKGYRLDTEKSKIVDVDGGLRDLEQSIIAVLTLALQYGDVHIVTNAETGWVQLSAAKFIPAVVPLLNRVTVLSARSTYEGRYPDAPLKWKYYAFQDKLAPLFADPKKQKNILSFGDSHVEREAVRAVTRGFPNTRCKSVKFAERPSLEQLRRQIELVTNCFQYIHHHEGDLDLQLTVTINNNNNNNQQPSSSQQQPQQQQQGLNDKIAQNNYQTNSILNTTEEKPSS
jgi:hypothetical protein